MKGKTTEGWAICPKKILTGRVRAPKWALMPQELVGVWVGRRISSAQWQKLMDINHEPLFVKGHIAIAVSRETGTTAVKYLGHMKTPEAIRAATIALRRAVRKVTGAQVALMTLPNYHAVSRALAL